MIFAPPVSPSANALPPSGGVFDLAGSEQRLQEIEQSLSRPGAWDKPEALTPLLQEKRRLEDEVERLGKLKTCHDDMIEWLALAAEGEDPEALESLDQQRAELARLLDETELVMLLSGEEDSQDAILEIHPGAGGTESQDWAEMLLRMYTRWAARRHYTVEELAMFGQIYANEQDYMIGDEGWDALYEKISALAAVKANDNEPVTIKDVIDMVAKAINHANGFFRKMKMGQKRYDENDYVILFAKDFGK